jgi:two-component system, NarL family, nitrate/nitrite response regulator NarL
MDRNKGAGGLVSVVLVQDNRLIREGIVAILSRHADIEIVGVAEDAEDAVLRVSQVDADVVLVDASLGDHDSHGLVRNIVKARAESRVVVMDVVSDPEDVIRFVRRGASGFVLKNADIETFVATIRSVAGGARVLPDALTGTIFSHIASEATTRARQAPAGAEPMTPREREIIDLIAEGASNKRISRELGISVHTVKSHMRNILEKLSLQSRLEVAAYAHRTAEGIDNWAR